MNKTRPKLHSSSNPRGATEGSDERRCNVQSRLFHQCSLACRTRSGVAVHNRGVLWLLNQYERVDYDELGRSGASMSKPQNAKLSKQV